MSGDRFDVLERFAPLFDTPEPSFDRFRQRRDRRRRRRRIATGVAGTAMGAALVAAAVTVLPLGDGPAPIEPDMTIAVSEGSAGQTTSTSTAPAEPSAIAVATGFAEAYGAHDADAVIAHLADDFVGGVELGDIGRTPREIGLVVSLFEAQHSQQILQQTCAEVDRSSDGVVVRCPFDSHGFGSAELGFGPYTGHSWQLTVRDGEVVEARIEYNNIEQIIEQTIRPFGWWVEANHPDDIPLMYINGNLTDFRLGEESAGLFEQRLEQYVAEQTAKLDTAEAMMAAWVEGDGEAVATTFAADGTWEGFAVATLPALHDWYRAVGWEHHNEVCALRPTLGNIGCSYTFENDLTRFLGDGPLGGSFALDIADGEVTTATNRYNPRHDDNWQTFHQWVEDNHPDDIEQMYTADTSFALWDPTSIELWARYVDDFVASADGYIARAESICAAAHARLNDELESAGIELDASPEDDGSGLQLIPHDEEDLQAYEEAARRVEREVLVELRAVAPPEAVRDEFDHAYDLLDQFAEAEPTTNTEPAELRNQVDGLGLGLQHCTFSIGD